MHNCSNPKCLLQNAQLPFNNSWENTVMNSIFSSVNEPNVQRPKISFKGPYVFFIQGIHVFSEDSG